MRMVPVIAIVTEATAARLTEEAAVMWAKAPAEVIAGFDAFAQSHGWTRDSLFAGVVLRDALDVDK